LKKLNAIIVYQHDKLLRLEDDWNLVYRLDPHAHIYISWAWISGWTKYLNAEWIIIALQDTAAERFVAFLPLGLHKLKLKSLTVLQRLSLGGQAYANYAGMLCHPEYEKEAIDEMASYLQHKMNWDTLKMSWIRDPRIAWLVRALNQKIFSVSMKQDLPLLRIKLPEDYEAFLHSHLGKSTRKRTDEKIKQFEKQDKIVFCESNSDTIEEDIIAHLEMWNRRWKKDLQKAWHKNILLQFFSYGLLRLTLLKDGDKVIAGLSCFYDISWNVCYPYITIYEPDYSKMSPGIILFMESIRHAIGRGYKVYDLAMGLDRYKLSFKPERIETSMVDIKRKKVKTSAVTGFLALRKRLLT
jgi:CelD/BcsL family acetyltransferase involved in cellulose biosynthesis